MIFLQTMACFKGEISEVYEYYHFLAVYLEFWKPQLNNLGFFSNFGFLHLKIKHTLNFSY